MTSIGIGAPRSAAPYGSAGGYGDAIAGLKSFDDLSRALGQRRDDALRRVTHGPAYPQPSHAVPGTSGTSLGAAVASYLNSEGGRATIERALAAAGTFVKGLLGEAGPTQLPLPFE